MLRRTVLKGIAATTASGLLAQPAGAETPLKIGISMPLTGAGFNAVGRQLQAALKFYMQQHGRPPDSDHDPRRRRGCR
jgi:hypothetical protein